MLSKSRIAEIAKILKVDQSTFEAAITSADEVDVAIPEGATLYTATELATRDKSIKSASYEEGKDAGTETLIKEAKAELGLTFTGKDKAAFIAAVKAKEPNGDNADIQALRKSVTDAEKKATDAEQALNTFKLRSTVASKLPKNFSVAMTNDEALTILEANGFSFSEGDNGAVKITRNGQEVKDEKLQTPLDIDTVLTGFFRDEKKWIADPNQQERKGGRGGSSSKTDPLPTKLSEVEAAWTASGKSTNSADYSAHVQSLAKDNANFDMEA